MDDVSRKILFSIGHSSHPIERFLDLLQRHDIQAIADVRSSPYSRFNPQYSRDALESTLKQSQISYVFLGRELGARRDEPECYRFNKVDYELVAELPAFQEGIRRLSHGATKMRVAMLCAEKDPLTCHRTILVARFIKEHVDDIHHILASGLIETQSQVEDRLLREFGKQDGDFFISHEARLMNAYRARSEEIAYQETNPQAAHT